MFTKILVANRGEIALRIVRACRELGIASVAVFSDADKNALHVRFADQSIHIGPSISRKSYLDGAGILAAAESAGADAIHPGYGFLSESAAFAGACRDRGIAFIGPSREAIEAAGNKSAARAVMSDLGIPVIPGSAGIVRSLAEALSAAESAGYPVIVKASGGGGGRGIRIAGNGRELEKGWRIASAEANAAFGNPDIYIEKYLERPRHIEIQILADRFGNCVHLGERECSIQKRYQKLIEESPSPFLDEALRSRMGTAAVGAARAIGYENAGTMEFLVDGDRNFYFMEANARIQVEHPVTELVTGIDIVEQQIRIAAGERLPFRQEEIAAEGWAIECRINAADPEDDFTPSPGTIRGLILPGGPGVRVDTHIHAGCEVTHFYDSLLCKISVWGKNRDAAIRRMRRALFEFRADGIMTTAPYLESVLRDARFESGKIDTHFLDDFGTKPVPQ
jgi:acetyl-CoA carboxylase, biotin carboxylase subunit